MKMAPQASLIPSSDWGPVFYRPRGPFFSIYPFTLALYVLLNMLLCKCSLYWLVKQSLAESNAFLNLQAKMGLNMRCHVSLGPLSSLI